VIKRVAIFGTVALVAAVWPAVSGQPPLRDTYVVTQAYCLPPQTTPKEPDKCVEQSLPYLKTLEVQLPGTPSVWTVSSKKNGLTLLGLKKLRSPNRVEGTSEVYIFTFSAANQGVDELVFQETPPLLSQPGGTFTFRLTVTPR
jgi:hypothetical protein